MSRQEAVEAEQRLDKGVASSDVVLEPVVEEDFVLGQNSPKEPSGDDEVDWTIIAEYLSQCQSDELESCTTIDRTSQDESPLRESRLQAVLHSIIPSRYTISKRDETTGTLEMPRSPSSTTDPATPSASATAAPSAGLSTGAKAGIAGGIAIGVVIVLATLVTLHTRRRRKKYGYTRTKGKDSMAAELDGHFVVTTWPDHGEASPMIKPAHTRRESEAHVGGLGLEGLPGQSDYRHEMEGRGPLYNEERYVISPGLPQSMRTQSNIYSPTPQPYQPSPLLNRSPSPERVEPDPYEQHNKRARPAHPLSLLSEAIPPPKLQAREVHSMADYQNAVPLGFANGFVQVGGTEQTPDTPTRTWDSIQPTFELDLGERFNHGRVSEEADAERGLIQAAEEDRADEEAGNEDVIEQAEGDTELPQYEEMPGVNKKEDENLVKTRVVRESVRWDQATGHYHIDSESEDERDGPSSRRELTKEELG